MFSPVLSCCYPTSTRRISYSRHHALISNIRSWWRQKTVIHESELLPMGRRIGTALDTAHEVANSPLMTLSALSAHLDSLPYRGLLGLSGDEPVYMNMNAPSSGIVCGVQGSGKSHTVACMLENALVNDTRIGSVPGNRPLAALVFHFDEQEGERPCEAAFVSTASPRSPAALPKVSVLASPSAIHARRRAYANLENVSVAPLRLSDKDLTASRLLALMGFEDDITKMPLYMHTVLQIVRDIGSEQFTYAEFKRRVEKEHFDPQQRLMLGHRIHLLDGFLGAEGHSTASCFEAGRVTLIDLTDPFMDGPTATVLFDISLNMFMKWEAKTSKLVVLDEAHKYLTRSESTRLVKSLCSIVRQQRHLGTRVLISTQEPTIVPSTFLDLASFVFCHRFSSPSWSAHLSRHVGTGADGWQDEVMRLHLGEALVFAPSALITSGDDRSQASILGQNALRLRVRQRLSYDGGTSRMALDTASSNVGDAPERKEPPPPQAAGKVSLDHLIHALQATNAAASYTELQRRPELQPEMKEPPPQAARNVSPDHLIHALQATNAAASYATLQRRPELQHLRNINKLQWLQAYVLEAQRAGLVKIEDGPHGVQVSLRSK